MLARRLYYILKPYLPRSVRYALRRALARRILAKCGDTWPINPATAAPPAGWPGWPEGKKFAVIITHDVEGPEGITLTRSLAELEKSLGFRSSFNFIPEGDYRVDQELRDWLAQQGFEVGVHDFNHDGHLYSSRDGFAKKAGRINDYLREWGAVGYRSGFMLRNLDWHHQLNVLYDATTFDTDPFEPQPDGAHTIFPYWIPAPADQPGRPGYVELPYTLAQDSTLFILLQEPTNTIWKRKLDWVAAQGGMVLVNVHPDYLAARGKAGPDGRKSVRDHYADLLKYLSDTYAGSYWHVLPRDLAAYVHQMKDRINLQR